MVERGYLEGSSMAQAFNMLRPNDLIWSYYVNNYLKGKEPMPFDLLVWNSDSTRMPAANHIVLSAPLLSIRTTFRTDAWCSGGETLDLKTSDDPGL